MRKYFSDIVIQSKDDSTVYFRALLHCWDSRGQGWELRGYGSTPGEAASEAYQAYQKDESTWRFCGYQAREKI